MRETFLRDKALDTIGTESKEVCEELEKILRSQQQTDDVSARRKQLRAVFVQASIEEIIDTIRNDGVLSYLPATFNAIRCDIPPQYESLLGERIGAALRGYAGVSPINIPDGRPRLLESQRGDNVFLFLLLQEHERRVQETDGQARLTAIEDLRVFIQRLGIKVADEPHRLEWGRSGDYALKVTPLRLYEALGRAEKIEHDVAKYLTEPTSNPRQQMLNWRGVQDEVDRFYRELPKTVLFAATTLRDYFPHRIEIEPAAADSQEDARLNVMIGFAAYVAYVLTEPSIENSQRAEAFRTLSDYGFGQRIATLDLSSPITPDTQRFVKYLTEKYSGPMRPLDGIRREIENLKNVIRIGNTLVQPSP